MVAVQRVCGHHSANFIFISFGINQVYSGYFAVIIPLKPVGAGGGVGCMGVQLANYMDAHELT